MRDYLVFGDIGSGKESRGGLESPNPGLRAHEHLNSFLSHRERGERMVSRLDIPRRAFLRNGDEEINGQGSELNFYGLSPGQNGHPTLGGQRGRKQSRGRKKNAMKLRRKRKRWGRVTASIRDNEKR